jgi:hypothetical protein
MREDVRKILAKQTPKPTAREVLWPLFQKMPLGERGEPVLKELLWVIQGRPNPDTHEFILPEYCYHIFDKLRVTVFQAFPALNETVVCHDPNKLAQVKTYGEAKQYLMLDWYRFGKPIGITLRLLRYFEFEIENHAKNEGLWELEPSQEHDAVTMLGSQWLEKSGVSVANLPTGDVAATLIQMFAATAPDQNIQQIWGQVARQWGPEAMAEFNRGIADGIKEFMDENGNLAESTRTNNYAFFLILWPEIKGMLERNPLPNRTEVFEWLTPLHETGMISIPTIDNFRDFCEAIGLKFAGRTPQKP